MNDEDMMRWMAGPICCLIRGFMACFPNNRVEKMLILISAVFGQQVAATYAGDELAVFKLRKACRDAFGTAISSERVTPAPPPPQNEASIGVVR